MVEVKELRIGNLVYNGIGEIFPANVYTLQMPYSELGTIEPIPMSEEMLVKLGFADSFGSCYTNGNFTVDCSVINNTFKSHGVYIETVHQLQNLYFALTLTELKLEP